MHNPWKMGFFTLLGVGIFMLAKMSPASSLFGRYWWIAEALVVLWFFWELNHSEKPSSPSASP